MRRILPLLLLALLPEAASGLQPGVALRWDACLGDGGTANRAFACDTNSGGEVLVASFVPGRDFNGVQGFEPQVDFFSSTATIPAWWEFINAGACRTISLSMDCVAPAGAASCIDPAPGISACFLGTYEMGFLSPGRVRLRAFRYVMAADTFSLLNGQHYFAFMLRINHAKTTGTGACAGCSISTCIGFSGMRIVSLDYDPEPTFECHDPTPACGTRYMFGPADGAASDRVTWQGSAMPAFATWPFFGHEHPNAFGVTEATCTDAVTATRRSTWAAIKSHYR